MHSLAKNTCCVSIPVLTLKLLKNIKNYNTPLTLDSRIFRNTDNGSLVKLNK